MNPTNDKKCPHHAFVNNICPLCSSSKPTDITRSMRCPACSVVGTHTINASMANEPVLCPACAKSGKRSTCVAVEPTEEQRQAAFEFFATDQPNAWHQDWIAGHVVPEPASNDEETRSMVDLARLLAEREAKLREEADANIRLRVAAEDRTRLLQGLANTAKTEADTLRARVAELEAKQARLKHLANDEVAACALHIDSLEKLLAAYRATVAECVKVLRSVDDDASADPGVREEVRELVARLDAGKPAEQARDLPRAFCPFPGLHAADCDCRGEGGAR